jgi:hypothetical protein
MILIVLLRIEKNGWTNKNHGLLVFAFLNHPVEDSITVCDYFRNEAFLMSILIVN